MTFTREMVLSTLARLSDTHVGVFGSLCGVAWRKLNAGQRPAEVAAWLREALVAQGEDPGIAQGALSFIKSIKE